MLKKNTIVIALLAIVAVGASVFGYQMYNSSNSYKIFLQNQYQKNLYDLVTDVNNLEVSLSKVQVSESKQQNIILYGDIWRQASTANDRISSLPVATTGVSNITKFLSQVSDFSYAMLKRNNAGVNITDQQHQSIEKLKDYCGYITVQLNEFIGNVGEKGVTIEDLNKGREALTAKKDSLKVEFQNMSDQIQEYPTLIYDGPFSENVLKIKPKILEEKIISPKEAEKILYKLINKEAVGDVILNSSQNNYKIPSYSFNIKPKGSNQYTVNINISKNGGHVLYMLDSRTIQTSKISIDEAIKAGTKYLRSINFPSMMPTYTLKYDNVAIINFVAVKNKVLLYPEQIKLKVALDNGGIIGIESQQYLIAHHKRNDLKPKLSVQEAEKRVSTRLNINNIRLTLIPLESLREVLCYEFFGDYQGEKYFVYINANDGTEVKILKVINTNNGQLTM